METVNIIGGGIGGLALANALQCHGIDFKIFEQAPRLTEVGAAISISKAALDILEKFDLHEQIRNAGYETMNFHISDKNLKDIRVTTTESPVTIIHRAKLIDILVSNLPKEKTQLNTKLAAIKNEVGFSDLYFSNGLKLRSGCTAIAEGIHSISRKQIFPGLKIRYAGQAIWRGITTVNEPEQFVIPTPRSGRTKNDSYLCQWIPLLCSGWQLRTPLSGVKTILTQYARNWFRNITIFTPL
jgi:2-polyprenyl-6-methoxyphenol hydroxylase-like FAD-dependent oxidoreductase